MFPIWNRSEHGKDGTLLVCNSGGGEGMWCVERGSGNGVCVWGGEGEGGVLLIYSRRRDLIYRVNWFYIIVFNDVKYNICFDCA